jgi:BMFP domain-containing protein YqiC
MANVIWQGTIQGTQHRVVDQGAGAAERLITEVQGAPDAMGGRGWNRLDPIPRAVFESMLVQSGVVK